MDLKKTRSGKYAGLVTPPSSVCLDIFGPEETIAMVLPRERKSYYHIFTDNLTLFKAKHWVIWIFLLVMFGNYSSSVFQELILHDIFQIPPNAQHFVLSEIVWPPGRCWWLAGINPWSLPFRILGWYHFLSPVTVRWRKDFRFCLENTFWHAIWHRSSCLSVNLWSTYF